jgi:hypothetical protein
MPWRILVSPNSEKEKACLQRRQLSDYDDMTSFQIAVLTQQPPDILISLATNPGLHCLTSLGQTVLHLAVLRPSALALLLQKGVQDMVNQGDINGMTPLAYTVIYKIADSVRLLLRNGAKIYNVVTIQDDPDPFDAFSYCVCYGSDTWVDSPVTEAILTHWISDWVLESGDQATDPLRACRTLPVQQFMNKSFIANPCFGLPRWWSPYNLKFVHEGPLCALSNLTFIAGMETDWLYDSGLFMRVYTLAMHFDCAILQQALPTASHRNTATLSNFEVLKHLRAHEIRDCSSRGFRQGMDTWFYLGTIFKLHMQANLSSSPCDVCPCECGTNGCSILTEIAGTLNREVCGRSSDMRLYGVAVLLEWFLCLQASQSVDDLQKACQDLFRLQRFEELGIRHVCRIVHGSKTECWSGKRWLNTTLARGNESDLEDIEEIMDEDFPLIEQLEKDCYEFEQEDISAVEQAWIALLARRWVFLEARWMSPEILRGAEIEQTIATWESKSNVSFESYQTIYVF